MKVFVINLDKDKDKKLHMQQLCKEFGLDCEIFTAVNGKDLPPNLDSGIYSSITAKTRYGRELSSGEIGTALSHISIYKKIVSENIDISLILEDDVCFESDLLFVLNNLNSLPSNWECLLLGHHCSYSRDKESVKSIWFRGKISSRRCVVRFSETTYGAYGYLISLGGAKKLLDQVFPLYRPIDHYTGSDSFLNLYCVSPPIVKLSPKFLTVSNLSQDRERLERLRTSKNESYVLLRKSYRLVRGMLINLFLKIKRIREY